MLRFLIAAAKVYNRHHISFRIGEDVLTIHSQYSLFRLGVWLDGYCQACNDIAGYAMLTVTKRTKYVIEVTVK